MNEVIKTLLNHRSVRSYSDKAVKKEDIDLIVKAAQQAPSSIDGQQVTIISVEDKEKKYKLSKLVGDQKYIDEAPIFLVFCADFYRAKIAGEITGEKIIITDSQEANLVGAVDVGLAMGNAIAAAESLGLNIVPIGGIRKEPEEVIELLGLPEYVFPMVGLVLGYGEGPSMVKPRFKPEVIFHKERYNKDLLQGIKDYDKVIEDFMTKATGGRDTKSWSEMMSGTYKTIYYPKVKDALEKQGFKGIK